MKSTARWFWSVVLAQAAFLLGWAGWHQYVQSAAPVIKLKTLPVDPQDLLRGDYMILRYEISNAVPPPDAKNEVGKEFWVLLEPRDGFYSVVSTSMAKPAALAPGQIAVVGWTGSRGVAYGIESYYVPEGKGTPRFKTMEVEAAVSPTHRLYVKRVLIDGQAYP